MRDVSYIVANLCPEDRRELECQYPLDGLAVTLMMGEAWVATLDGQPAQAFGAISATCSVLTAWAFGTPRRARAIPSVSRMIRRRRLDCFARGITRVEARAISDHPTALRWLRGLGGTETPLPCWGKDGQDFTLFSWTRDAWAVPPVAA